jgi:hypothetical protein
MTMQADDDNKLFVGGLPWALDSEDLREVRWPAMSFFFFFGGHGTGMVITSMQFSMVKVWPNHDKHFSDNGMFFLRKSPSMTYHASATFVCACATSGRDRFMSMTGLAVH